MNLVVLATVLLASGTAVSYADQASG
ncbi:hypothetical protein GQ600_12686 [Phytophthora cactorum]|nr:hypothetical protein GQ600_12686 [Phytophthora cactorum]